MIFFFLSILPLIHGNIYVQSSDNFPKGTEVIQQLMGEQQPTAIVGNNNRGNNQESNVLFCQFQLCFKLVLSSTGATSNYTSGYLYMNYYTSKDCSGTISYVTGVASSECQLSYSSKYHYESFRIINLSSMYIF